MDRKLNNQRIIINNIINIIIINIVKITAIKQGILENNICISSKLHTCTKPCIQRKVANIYRLNCIVNNKVRSNVRRYCEYWTNPNLSTYSNFLFFFNIIFFFLLPFLIRFCYGVFDLLRGLIFKIKSTLSSINLYMLDKNTMKLSLGRPT